MFKLVLLPFIPEDRPDGREGIGGTIFPYPPRRDDDILELDGFRDGVDSFDELVARLELVF